MRLFACIRKPSASPPPPCRHRIFGLLAPGGSEGRGGMVGGCAVLSQVLSQVLSLSCPDPGALSPANVPQPYVAPVFALRQQSSPPVGSFSHLTLLLSLAVRARSVSSRAVIRIPCCLWLQDQGGRTRHSRCGRHGAVQTNKRGTKQANSSDYQYPAASKWQHKETAQSRQRPRGGVPCDSYEYRSTVRGSSCCGSGSGRLSLLTFFSSGLPCGC